MSKPYGTKRERDCFHVRMPAALKEKLIDEVEYCGGSLNDVIVRRLEVSFEQPALVDELRLSIREELRALKG